MSNKTQGNGTAAGLSAFQREALARLGAGSAIKDIVGLRNADVETVHRIGVGFADQGKYGQAQPMFQFACLYAHDQPRYWSSLGNCRQMLKDYAGAIDAFMMSHLLDDANPWPGIHMATCFLAAQDKKNAANALQVAEQAMAGGKADDRARQRIAALRQAL